MEIEEIKKDILALTYSTEEFPSEHFIWKIVEYLLALENRVKTLEESLGRVNGELGIFRPLRS